MLRKIWDRWFKDSETNLLADFLTFIGALAEVASALGDEPFLRDALVAAGINPIWLLVLGIVIRVVRRMRDPGMA